MNYAVMAAIAAGGAVGSVARCVMNGWIQSVTWTGFPFGILTVNISGGFIMGVLTELMALKLNVSLEMSVFLIIGVLAGYTTFSTISLDSVLLIERHNYASAVAYIAGSALLSILALFAGLWVERAL